MKKSKQPLSNNVALGIAMLIITNGVFIALSILISRYIRIYPKYFILGLSGALIVVLLINLIFIFGYYFKRKIFRRLMIGLSTLFIIAGGSLTFYVYRSSSLIDQMIDLDGKENVEYVLVSLTSGKIIEDMNNQTIAYMDYEADFDVTIDNLMKEYDINYVLERYDSLSDIVVDVASGSLQYVVLPKEYQKLTDALALEVNPFENSEILLNFDTRVDDGSVSVDVSKDPFTILLMGNNEGLTDSIILASYNPKLQSVTMTSIPRDSYVPIACQNGRYDKINHSRAISRQCFIETVENYVDVDVNFYFETDFYAIVKIVNALGGLEITSPVSFSGTLLMENENRYVDVTVPEGTNILNGEQVLTFARERHHMPRGDYDRQLNQQYVIKQIVTKILSTRNPNKLIEILDAAKNNIVTNLSMDSITALMGHAIEAIGTSPLKPMDAFRIESTQIIGEGDTTYYGMWIMRPYQTEVRNATLLVEHNLNPSRELLGETHFEFTYRIPYIYSEDYNIFNEPREALWQGSYEEMPETSNSDTNEVEQEEQNNVPVEETQNEKPSKETISVIDFSLMSNSEIEKWGNDNGISITFSNYETSDTSFVDGQFWYQSVGSGTLIEKGMSIDVVRVKIIPSEDASLDDQGGNQDEGSN